MNAPVRELPPDPELMGIGKRIASRRKQFKLSQAKLGEQVGVTQSAVTQWENGIVIPRTEALLPLTRSLGVSLDWLLTGVGAAPEPRVPTLGTSRDIDQGLSALQVATLEALETAILRKLVPNERCLAILTEWQTRVDAGQ